MLIDIPGGRQTFDYDCGAKALQLVFAYYGIDFREDLLLQELSCTPDGALVKNIVAVAEKQGFKVSVESGSSLDKIKKAIDAGRPVIVLVQAWADRYMTIEGGGRANYGVQYTAQFNQGGFLNALFGQSYSLFGQNSFAQGGTTNTGLGSGIDTRGSDYVARFSYQPNSTYMFTSRFRFDNDQFTVQRTELEARAKFDRWNVSMLYGDYAAQPELGFLNRRQGILGTGLLKLDANWALLGAARYDINASKFDQTRIGFGYIDDCLILALNYITNYTYGSGLPTVNHTFMLQLNLRTLGGTSFSQAAGF